MKLNYREMDIGLLSAQITLMAASLSLGSCMIGWFSEEKVQEICGIDSKVYLIISIGYPSSEDKIRDKVRKTKEELISFVE